MIRDGLIRDRSGSAAAEFALVLPILLLLMMGSMELGNYFLSEHVLEKGVRDGARYAARRSFDDFATCDSAPTGTVSDDTKQLVRTGVLSGGTDRLPHWDEATFSLTTKCSTGNGSVTYTGLYSGMASGARYVEVSASLPYQPILGLYGFATRSLTLNATEQAPVDGI